MNSDVLNRGGMSSDSLGCKPDDRIEFGSAVLPVGNMPLSLVVPDDAKPVDETTLWPKWVHHPIFGIKLKDAMYYQGMECYLEYKDGPPPAEYKSHYDFIIQKLKSQPTDAAQGNQQAGAPVLTGGVAPKWKTTGLQQHRE